MKTLVANPWCGSLLGELMCWQGWLRRLSKSYNKTIIVAPEEKRFIYEDFATKFVDETPNIKGADYVGIRDVPVNFISQQPTVIEQDFVVLGSRVDPLYHATIEADTVYPLTRKGWAEIICKMDDTLDIAWVSDQSNCFSIGGTDLRNGSLKELHKAILSSKVVAATSGGIAALALLSKVPVVTWINKDQVSLYRGRWNPFSVPGVVFRGRPARSQVEAAMNGLVSYSEPEPQPVSWQS